jgi:hypothetical protein
MNPLTAATEYALAKQVPDMARGCTVETSYGGVELDATEGAKVGALVERLLRARSTRVRREAQPECGSTA